MLFSPGRTWSHTMGKDLRDCRRRLYYRVFGSWGGWNARSNEEARTLYMLKQSRTLPMYGGILVHSAVEKILQRHRVGLKVASDERLVDRIEERMRSDISYSAARRWEEVNSPKQATLILLPHQVGEDLMDTWIEDSIDRCQRCLQNFLTSYLPELLEIGPKQWVIIEGLDRIRYRDFDLFVSPDLVYRVQDDATIIDWKTGERPDVPQLSVYAFYLEKWVRRTTGADLTELNIIGRSIPLLSPDNEGKASLGIEEIEVSRLRIEQDLDELEKLQSPGEARDKTPFPRTEHRGQCQGCIYQSYCEEDED